MAKPWELDAPVPRWERDLPVATAPTVDPGPMSSGQPGGPTRADMIVQQSPAIQSMVQDPALEPWERNAVRLAGVEGANTDFSPPRQQGREMVPSTGDGMPNPGRRIAENFQDALFGLNPKGAPAGNFLGGSARVLRGGVALAEQKSFMEEAQRISDFIEFAPAVGEQIDEDEITELRALHDEYLGKAEASGEIVSAQRFRNSLKFARMTGRFAAMPEADTIGGKIAAGLGQFGGFAFSPENFVLPGAVPVRAGGKLAATAVGRLINSQFGNRAAGGIVAGSGINAAINVPLQQEAISSGRQDEFSWEALGLDASMGAAFGGVFNATPAAARAIAGKLGELMRRDPVTITAPEIEAAVAAPDVHAQLSEDPDVAAFFEANNIQPGDDARALEGADRLADRRFEEANRRAAVDTRQTDPEGFAARPNPVIEAGQLSPEGRPLVAGRDSADPGLEAGRERYVVSETDQQRIIAEHGVLPESIQQQRRLLATLNEREAGQASIDAQPPVEAGEATSTGQTAVAGRNPSDAGAEAGRSEFVVSRDDQLRILDGYGFVPDSIEQQRRLLGVLNDRDRVQARSNEDGPFAVAPEDTPADGASSPAERPDAFRPENSGPGNLGVIAGQRPFRTKSTDGVDFEPNSIDAGTVDNPGTGKPQPGDPRARQFEDAANKSFEEQRAASEEDLVRQWEERQRAHEEASRRNEESARQRNNRDNAESARYQNDKNFSNEAAPDADGRYAVDQFGLVRSTKGGPIRFANQKQAAKWVMNEGHKRSPDQVFELHNHPVDGFTVRQRGTNDATGDVKARAEAEAARKRAEAENPKPKDDGPPPREPDDPPPKDPDDPPLDAPQGGGAESKPEAPRGATTRGASRAGVDPAVKGEPVRQRPEKRKSAHTLDSRVAENVSGERDTIRGLIKGGARNKSPGQTLMQFIRSKGGMTDPDGDLRGQDLHKRKGIINDEGMSQDDMFIAAKEQGFFPDVPDNKDGSINTDDAVNDIQGAMRTADERYSEFDQRHEEWVASRKAEDNLARELDYRGIDYTKLSDFEVSERLAAERAKDGDAPEAKTADASPPKPKGDDPFDIPDFFDDGGKKQTPEQKGNAKKAKDMGPTFYANPLDPALIARVIKEAIRDIGGFTGRIADDWYDQLSERMRLLGSASKTTTPRAFVRTVLDGTLRLIAYSNDGMLRTLASRYKSDAISDIANMFFAPAGAGRTKGAVSRTYHEAVDVRHSTNANKLARILEPVTKGLKSKGREAVLLQLGKMLRQQSLPRGNKPIHKAAREIRDLLNDELQYQRDAGMEVGRVEGYLPRQLDTSLVLLRPAEFKKRAAQLYETEAGMSAGDAKAAADEWFQRILQGDMGFVHKNNDFVNLDNAGTGTRFEKSRVFGVSADKVMGDFYLQNPVDVLPRYFLQSARRAEWVRRMGNELEKWDALKERMIEEGAGDAIPQVVANLQSATGTMKSVVGPGRIAYAAGRLWTTFGFLDRATITSLSEPTLAAVRSGRPFEAVRAYGDTLKHWVPIYKSKGWKKEARDLAEDLGFISGVGDDMLLQERFGGNVEGQAARALTGDFFRRTGLHAFTESTRIAAMRVAQRFIRRMAMDVANGTNLQRSARLYLKELGVPDDKIDGFAKWVKDNDGEINSDLLRADKGDAEMYRTAMGRFTDQTIMRPNASQRPRYAQHPLGQIIYALQSFLYSFHKTVIERIGRNLWTAASSKDLGVADRLRLAVPIAMTPITVASQYYIGELRDIVFRDPAQKNREPRSEFDKMLLAISRAGFLGINDLPANLVRSMKYSKDPATAMLGPLFGSLSEIFSKSVNLTTDRNSSNTNTAERAVARAVYDTVVQPMIAATGALLPGLNGVGFAAGTLAIYGATLPSTREAFVKPLVGPAEQRGGRGSRANSKRPGDSGRGSR